MQILTGKQAGSVSIGPVFSGLMELYERNYIGLRKLIPEQDALGEEAVSVVRGCLDLHYSLLERCKYTSIFRLTYHFKEADYCRVEPNLEIRVYHDARVAEVISGTVQRNHYRYAPGFVVPGTAPSIVRSKWKLNRFLHKWLNFCIKQGHQFRAAYPAGDVTSLLSGVYADRD